MSRNALLLTLLLVLAGCVGGPGSPTPDPPTASNVPTTTATPPDTTPREPVRVHYVIGVGGEALDEFRSVTVTVRSVAFREGTGGQCHGPLYPPNATLTPTQTPDPDRGLDCVVFDVNRTLELTGHTDSVSLGAYTVPAVVADDTFLVVTPQEGTLQNGTRVRFDEDDPGFAAVPARDEEAASVGLAVEEGYGGYAVTDRATVEGSATPTARYEVTVDGPIENGETATVTVRHDGDPAAGVRLDVTGRTFTTDADGEVTLTVEHARVFEVTVENATTA